MTLIERILVSDVMNQEVIVCRASDTIETVVMAMIKYGISGMPVIDARERVIGVISEKDIARVLAKRSGLSKSSQIRTSLEWLLFAGTHGGFASEKMASLISLMKNETVKDHMSAPPVMVSTRASLRDALRLMVEKRVNRLPVVDKNRLVGIITRGDVMSFLARELWDL